LNEKGNLLSAAKIDSRANEAKQTAHGNVPKITHECKIAQIC
jgi:hypothetical protein